MLHTGTKHAYAGNFNALFLRYRIRTSAVNDCKGLCHEVTAFI